MSLINLSLPPQPAFEPTAKQRRLLNYIHEHPSFKTVHELCRAAGIARSSYYLWTQDPAFRRWMTSAWSARLLLDGAVLLNIARANAGRSYPYWKALFDLTFDPRGHSPENRTNPTAPHFAPSAKCALRSSAPQPSEAGPQRFAAPLNTRTPAPTTTPN